MKNVKSLCLIEHRVMKRGGIAPRIINLGRLQVQATLTPQKHTPSRFILDSELFGPQRPSGYGAEEKNSCLPVN